MESLYYHVGGLFRTAILDFHVGKVRLVGNWFFVRCATVIVEAVPDALAAPPIWLVLIFASATIINVNVYCWRPAFSVVGRRCSSRLIEPLLFKRPSNYFAIGTASNVLSNPISLICCLQRRLPSTSILGISRRRKAPNRAQNQINCHPRCKLLCG